MNRLTLLLTLGFILNTTAYGQGVVKFPIKAANITYTQFIGGEELIANIYFDDYGEKYCVDIRSTIEENPLHIRVIMFAKNMFFLQMDNKTYKTIELRTDNIMLNQFYYLFSERLAFKDGCVVSGEQEFFGKKCKVYSLKNKGVDLEFISWKGLIIKQKEIYSSNVNFLEATSFIEKSPDQSWFEVPSDFTPQTLNFLTKAAIIKYSFSYDNEKVTTKHLYFDDNGRKLCEDNQYVLNGKNYHDRQIIDGKDIFFHLDINEKTFRTYKDMPDEELREMNCFMDEIKAIEEGYFKKGAEVVSGKMCRVYYRINDGYLSECWVWNNIVLKKKFKSKHVKYSFVAENITETLPDNIWFEVPSDFTIEED